ncbi:DnaB-like helicase C-terminal domain-containing protein [Helicobacter bizzozeronii]|uniref:DnaB-like helicase C-terminal domain-containing protein n=1 Tax=Helicobacter bizzozeronii TaxID=56877 RepID=UPI000CED8678|nr:DnaB-like helicase C-terminal domain-containing protein [Helicobacter bizzozeronii]
MLEIDSNLLEKNIIASLIVYPQYLEEMLEGIALEHFEPLHQKVLKALLELKEQNKDITYGLLAQELGEQTCQSPEFNALLSQETQSGYLSLKEDLKKALLLKTQRKLADQLAKACFKGEIFDMDFLSKYARIEAKDNARPLAEWEEEFENQSPMPKISSGMDFLDKTLEGGFELRQLVLIGGDPEAGKTMLGVQILRHMSLIENVRVAYFAFEFPLKKFVAKMKATQELAHKKIIDKWDFEACEEGSGIEELIAQIKRLARRGVKVFLIDSQGWVIAPKGRTPEEEETHKFTRIAQLINNFELDILIFLIVQSSKEQNSKSNSNTPMKSKMGAYMASIYLHIHKVNEREWPDEKERPYVRHIFFEKNKQTGWRNMGKFKADPKHYQFIQIAQSVQDLGKKDLNFLKENR